MGARKQNGEGGWGGGVRGDDNKTHKHKQTICICLAALFGAECPRTCGVTTKQVVCVCVCVCVCVRERERARPVPCCEELGGGRARGQTPGEKFIITQMNSFCLSGSLVLISWKSLRCVCAAREPECVSHVRATK